MRLNFDYQRQMSW